MQFNTELVIKAMQKDTRLFISERDLQVSFIIYAQKLYPGLKFLPEYSYTDKEGNNYRIDLMITDGQEFIAIEFKYVTAKGTIAIPGNDNYVLKNHSAIDIRRHQCVKDVSKLEAYKKMPNVKCTCGYLLLISNLKYFWEGSDRTQAGAQFDIKEGSDLKSGLHKFVDGFKVAETHLPIHIDNDYINLHYEDYLINHKEQVQNKKLFKYLLVKV